jgi:sugar lactone lactonase YvrE
VRGRWLAVACLAAALPAAAAPPLAPGDLVVADRGANVRQGRLYRLAADATGLEVVETSEPLVMPTAVVVDGDGTLVVADLRLDEPGRIVRVDPATGAVTTIADGWPLLVPVAVAIGAAGDVLVADLDAGRRLDFPSGSLAGTGAVYRIPRASGVPEVLSHDCCPWNASALALIGPDRLVVADMGFMVFAGDGALALVDATSGIQQPLPTSVPLLDPSGIAVGPMGTLVVTEATNPQTGPGTVLAIDPRTGTVAILGQRAPITDPRAVATTPDGDLVVADSAARAVYRIALPERTLDVLVAGDPLVAPWGVAVAPGRPYP